MQNPNLIPSTKGAAEYLGVSERTLYEWLASGKYNVPHMRVGNKYAFDRRDLDAWHAKRKRNTPTALSSDRRPEEP